MTSFFNSQIEYGLVINWREVKERPPVGALDSRDDTRENIKVINFKTTVQELVVEDVQRYDVMV